jgi:hypothetical protein
MRRPIMKLHSTKLQSTEQHSTEQHRTKQHRTEQHSTKSRSRTAGLLAATVVIAGSMLAAAVPAQAYDPDPAVKFAKVDTDDCRRLSGSLPVTPAAAGCYLYDDADDTFFKKDPGGVAVKQEFSVGSNLVSKVEFHPDGELLWIYDTRNDGDTLYVRIWTRSIGYSAVYYAPGTDAEVDMRDPVNFSIPDGDSVCVHVYDDVDVTDLVDVTCGTA